MNNLNIVTFNIQGKEWNKKDKIKNEYISGSVKVAPVSKNHLISGHSQKASSGLCSS